MKKKFETCLVARMSWISLMWVYYSISHLCVFVLAEIIDRKQVNATLCRLGFCRRVNALLHKYHSSVDQAVERVT